MTPHSPLVVIGGSAGALPALLELASQLPHDFAAPVLVVIHTPPDQPSFLPRLLESAGPLPAQHARQGERPQAGRIYVAPPDHHLLVTGSHLQLSRGPRENRSRPAIDVLFRSAAQAHGPRVTGVVLSGMLDDGTSGLWTVKQLGGQAIVQHPEDAEYSSMPLSALRTVEVDHILRARDLGPELRRLVSEQAAQSQAAPDHAGQGQAGPPQGAPGMDEEQRRQLQLEVAVAAEQSALQSGILDFGTPSPLACPECHGVLLRFEEGRLIRFRCHTGHAYTAETLLAEVREAVEKTLWNATRALDEQVILLSHLGRHLAQTGEQERSAALAGQAQEISERAEAVRQLTLSAVPGGQGRPGAT